MKENRPDNEKYSNIFMVVSFLAVSIAIVLLSACSELVEPKVEPFIAHSTPPITQEFRWSNGKSLKSFDPAKAAAAPETDVVRALYEGLTNIDPKTLAEKPGVAESWKSSPDQKTWTFYLRKNAVWSNGEPVTASDFVRSWKRLAELGQNAAHNELLNNIVGLPLIKSVDVTEPTANLLLNPSNSSLPILPATPDIQSQQPTPAANTATHSTAPAQSETAVVLGFAATDERTLTVKLKESDKDLPKLVAHPIFSPIFRDETNLASDKLNPALITNGAFKIRTISSDEIAMDRSDLYWNHKAVSLETIKFVPMENGENALAAYRAGTLDAVTNAAFEPLALKLLSPYEDFRKSAHAALNFYEVNLTRAPFNNRLVRQALSNAIERERLTEGELEGSTQPATAFLPFGPKTNTKVSQDKEKARDFLDEAGYPNGENFPTIRLVVNRNDAQQRIARVVARMWKDNLNVETEIIVKEAAELEAIRNSGDFDLVRRGVVFPVADAEVSYAMIFGDKLGSGAENLKSTPEKAINVADVSDESSQPLDENISVTTTPSEDPEERAIYEMKAIPLYYPTSYSLIKPYLLGFEVNVLDLQSLADVSIDNNWQPKKAKGESQ